MKSLGFIVVFAGIIGVIAPFIKIIFSKGGERGKQQDLVILMLFLFIVLPVLGSVANFLFSNDFAVGAVVIMGLIGINYCVFKDKF